MKKKESEPNNFQRISVRLNQNEYEDLIKIKNKLHRKTINDTFKDLITHFHEYEELEIKHTKLEQELEIVYKFVNSMYATFQMFKNIYQIYSKKIP